MRKTGTLLGISLALAESKNSEFKDNYNIRKYEVYSYVNISKKLAIVNINNN